MAYESEFKALVTIIWNDSDGEHKYDLPKPTTYSGKTSTMVDSGISVSGHLLGSVVRDNVAQISLSWNYLRLEDWTKINQLFKERYINTVTFFDQSIGKLVEKPIAMYISDRSAGVWRQNSEGNVIGWTGCSLQLTEV